MKKDEMAVQNIQACFKEFDSEPFDVSTPILRSLQSAIHASPDLLSDLKNALKYDQDRCPPRKAIFDSWHHLPK